MKRERSIFSCVRGCELRWMRRGSLGFGRLEGMDGFCKGFWGLDGSRRSLGWGVVAMGEIWWEVDTGEVVYT